MRIIIDVVIGFVTLGVIEAVVKPIAKRFVQRKVLRYAPILLEYLDRQMPQLLGQYSGAELEQIVNAKLEELTGETWNKAELDQVFGIFDVRVTADRTRGA
jgi:hypothetical protein